jgi:F420-non-reducing hydrogenase iron-sulfur subunit
LAAPAGTCFMNHRAVNMTVFYCSHHLEAGRFSALGGGLEGDTIKAISLPCSGKVDVPYLIKALETGADGVAIVSCPRDECRHFEGNLRAHKRAEAVESLLEEIGLDAGRIDVFECGEEGAGQVLDNIRQFLGRLRHPPATQARRRAPHTQESTVA